MKYLWIIILSLSVLTAFGQKSARVRELENQRKAALAEIEMTNKLLAETKKSAQNSLNRLNLLSQQILQRKKVISLLTQEMNALDKEIADIRVQLEEMEKELGDKKVNYGKSVQGIQRRQSSQDKLLFILSADNFSQSLRRMRYLREYADWQREQAGQIITKQKEINEKREQLLKTRTEKQALLNEREAESRRLAEEESGQKKEVDELNKRQRQLQDDLKKKQRQAAALNRQIEKQIQDEIARAKAEAEAARKAREKAAAEGKQPPKGAAAERVAESEGGYAMTKEERALSSSFAGNKGRLPYPIKGEYSVVSTFGEHQHPDLKHVRTQNNGIDIQVRSGADATAVFNGEVTAVFMQPGYNKSVIVRHGNYLTVYSNLADVYVKKGDKVKTGQAIGRIYTDTDHDNATILHLELWKETEKLNPQLWLAR